MSIIQIQKVQREGARLLVMLCGVSGGGKTYTAIQLAYGLAGKNASKVGLLDTENGRGRLYADELPEPYLYAELKPPFSPQRYIAAIEEFSQAGVEVLVIDSGSHEYEGIGGLIEIAEAGNPRLPNWNRAKGEHKRFMSALLASPMHIILCLRAREKATPEKGPDGKLVYRELGLQPITEKNVVFEATASLMLHDQGKRQDVLKVPAALSNVLGRGTGYLTADDGVALRNYVLGAKQLDPKVEQARGIVQLACEQGTEALRAAWSAQPPAIRKALGNAFLEQCKASAAAFDEQVADDDDAPFDALNAAAATKPAAAPEPTPTPAAEPEPAGNVF